MLEVFLMHRELPAYDFKLAGWLGRHSGMSLPWAVALVPWFRSA